MFFTGKGNRGKVQTLGLMSVISLMLVAALPGGACAQTIPLPNGFQPEGIALGNEATFFVGSIPTGDIFRGDLATGKGEVFIEAADGRQAIGLEFDSRTELLYAAGGPTGMAFVYDTTNGEEVAAIQLTDEENTFVNDNVVTDDAVYFTESARPVFYRVPLDENGELPDNPTSEEVELSGDFDFVPDAFNSNGIVATPGGEHLIIVSSVQASLYRVDSQTGEAVLIDLGGDSLPNGDGLLLDGTTLYVVQNQLNQIAVVKLNDDHTAGEIVDTLTSELFRVPTTIAHYRNALYAVNARFGTTPTPDTEYEVVRVPLGAYSSSRR